MEVGQGPNWGVAPKEKSSSSRSGSGSIFSFHRSIGLIFVMPTGTWDMLNHRFYVNILIDLKCLVLRSPQKYYYYYYY
jgi:hypothetical protein